MAQSRVSIQQGTSHPKLKSMSQSLTQAMSRKSMSRLKLRKHSYGFSGIGSIKPVERTSQLAIEFRRPPLLYLNTYQLDSHTPFNTAKVEKAAETILDEYFTDHVYNAQESPMLSMRIAGDLMRECKTMDFNRYRIITVVSILQKRAQCYNNAIAFLWDYERDNVIDVQRETNTAYIQVTAFGIYLD